MVNNNDRYFFAAILFTLILLGVDLAWGITDYLIYNGQIDAAIAIQSYTKGFLSMKSSIKLLCIGLLLTAMITQSGAPPKTKWTPLVVGVSLGLILFLLPMLGRGATASIVYCVTTLLGYVLIVVYVPPFSRKLFSYYRQSNPNGVDTFEQESQCIQNEDSINLPIKYRYKGRLHDGWINIVAPFRSTMVLGTPGSGKSFSVLGPAMSTLMKRHFSFFCYDYKYPTLVKDLYFEYKETYGDEYEKQQKRLKDGDYIKPEDRVPQFCVINFNDPRYSMRSNPIHPDYIQEPADAYEVAELIMNNISKETSKDFFYQSAISFIAACIWMLRCYKDGIYCTFPHLIELLNRDYTSVFDATLMQIFEGRISPWIECRTIMTAFDDAKKGGAGEQLQGQIASARIPLSQFASPLLYWTLSGDDFKLDINNPEHPRVLCVGNNPDREQIFSTTLALYTSRMFKLVNHPGRRKTAVFLDEMPTIKLKKLDNLINTARSNKVAIFIGAQDKSQIIRDYTEKEANVVFNSVGTYVCGQVNGSTARDLSQMFGKEFRSRESESRSDNGTSVNTSYQLEEILPSYKIENLSTGTFFGRTADVFDTKLKNKLFCGEIQVDKKHTKALASSPYKLPRMDNGAFKDEQIIKNITKDQASIDRHCINYLTEKLRRQNEAECSFSRIEEGEVRSVAPLSINILRGKAEKEYNSYRAHQKAELLEIIKKKAIDDEIARVTKDNFTRIRADINAFFDAVDKPDGKVSLTVEDAQVQNFDN